MDRIFVKAQNTKKWFYLAIWEGERDDDTGKEVVAREKEIGERHKSLQRPGYSLLYNPCKDYYEC